MNDFYFKLYAVKHNSKIECYFWVEPLVWIAIFEQSGFVFEHSQQKSSYDTWFTEFLKIQNGEDSEYSFTETHLGVLLSHQFPEVRKWTKKCLDYIN